MDTPQPQNPYDALGVAPTSEEVVIRAAWRALMRKHLAADHGQPLPGDRRAREINAAYELLSDPDRRRAWDHAHKGASATAAPAAPVAAAGAAALTPARRHALAGLGFVLGILMVIAIGLSLRHTPKAPASPPAARPGLKIHKPAPRPPSSLPCYVNGAPAGNMPLAACAARNGVATGPLETGIEPASAKDRAPGLVVVPPRSAPAATPATAPASPPSGQGGAADSIALARAFYGALGGGDGYAAAAMIEPEKRRYGRLSGAQMSRFYGSLREPLRLTSMYPLAPDTIFVRYRFTTRGGGVCVGAANVITAQRGGRLFIHAIRAYKGC